MVKTLVVDGARVQRQAIVDALLRVVGITVQGAVSTYSAAVRAILEARPDIVVMGTELGDGSALELLVAMREQRVPPGAIVVGPARQSLTHSVWGAHRYVPNDRDVERVADAVIAIARDLATTSTRQAAAS